MWLHRHLNIFLACRSSTTGRLYLKAKAREQAYSSYVASEPGMWRALAVNVDARILSTPVAGGFMETYIGMYASSNGQPGTNNADFDWFEYVGLDEER